MNNNYVFAVRDILIFIATRYGLEGGEIFRNHPDSPRDPNCQLYNV